MTPGERIKILRMLSGYTQEKLAEFAGVNRASLVSWERGDYNPSAPAVEALGKVLVCPPGYILFGTPSPLSGLWQPTLPKVGKYVNTYLQDLELLFPSFCAENHITFCAYCPADNGRLLFLGKPENILKYALLLKPPFLERFSVIVSGLEVKEIGLKGNPPITLGSLESETAESLSTYFSFAQTDDISIDTGSICTTFLKAKKVRGATTKEDTKGLIRNAFLQFNHVLQEFDPPDYMRHPALIDELSVVFVRLYEEIEERSLTWDGALDKNLAQIVRNSLTKLLDQQKLYHDVKKGSEDI